MGWGSKRSPATGRAKREAVNHKDTWKGGPQRSNGKVVRKGRLEFARSKAEKRPRKWL